MRLLCLSHLYPHAAEARYGIFVARQLQAMAEAGADIELLVPRFYCPPWLHRLLNKPASYNHHLPLHQIKGVPARPVPFLCLPGAWYHRWAGRAIYWAALRQARQLHRQAAFDAVYGTHLLLSGHAAVLLGRTLGVPSYALAIGSDVNVAAKHSPALQSHFRRVTAQLTGTLACGAQLAAELDRHRPTPSLCVQGVVDLQQFRPVTDASERTRLRRKLRLPALSTQLTATASAERNGDNSHRLLLYVGYLWKRKGLIELIAAFATVKQQHPNTSLVICGAGDDQRDIQSAAAASPVSASIHFAGPVAPDEVASYLQAADVFVLPSYAEGMPNVLMEALACGLPCVSTDVGGISAAVGDCSAVRLVPPRKVAPLAAAISSQLNDRSLDMRLAARAKAESDFGAAGNARRILDFLSTRN